MARRKNGRGSQYAKPTTVGNGTMSFQLNAGASEVDVTVGDVLSGIGLNPKTVGNAVSNNAIVQAAGSTLGYVATMGHYYAVIDLGTTNPGSGKIRWFNVDNASNGVDAIKISSVTCAPNSGTRLPIEINFRDGQLFRCDNAMKPTKVKPSDKSPAGLWQDASDTSKVLFSIKGSNTANPIRVGVAVRQF